MIYTTPTRDAIEILDLRTLKRTALTRLGKDPAWSPDGRYVALVREPTYDAYQDETVWLCALDSPQPRRVVSGGCPSWSSDGKTLYVHDRKKSLMLAVNVDDPELKATMFFDRPRSWYPAVSPDGKQIAFGAREQLEIVDRLTGATVFTWPTPGNRGLLLAWSPDGKFVAFGGFLDSTLGLWVLDVAARKAVPVLEGQFTSPAWSKDGSRLAFDQRTVNRREVWVVSRAWVEARLKESGQPQGTESSKREDRKEALLRIPPRDPATKANLIDLSAYYNGSISEGWLPTTATGKTTDKTLPIPLGVGKFDDVEFDVRGLIQLSGNRIKAAGGDFPQQVKGIKVGLKGPRLHFLQAAAWGGYVADGAQIGRFVLHYANGSEQEIPIVVGEHLHDWHGGPGASVNLRSAKVVWSGINPAQAPVRVFKRTWENPLPDEEIQTIDYMSSMTEAAPFLIAITVE